MLDNVLIAFQDVFTVQNIILIIFGTLMGITIGALPGLSVNMGIAVLFPVTFAFKGVGGILMLLGVYCGAIYGGSISAILLKTPGTPASAATTLDGYPMAVEKKQPGRALGISTFASVFAGMFSCVMLIVFAPMLAKVATSFSAPDYFALAFFGISVITSVSTGSMIKGVMGGVLGLLIATIGMDPMVGRIRFTFDSTYMLGGISFVPVLIGLFAFSQALKTIEDTYGKKDEKHSSKIKKVFPTGSDFKRIFPTVLRSSVIGTFIGCIPGTGGDIGAFISYNEAKRWSKHKDEFGTGVPEGVAAPEAGNNSVSGGAMIPMLTLGIPGDGATAILLGAFMVQNIQPGPMLFTQNAHQVYGIFMGLLLANILMAVFGFSGIRLFAKVINVPKKMLIPIIIVLCCVGAYSINHMMIDVCVMAFFGILGYFMNRLQFSMSAVVIGMILGNMAESNLRRSMVMYGGDTSVFFTRPISCIFIIITVITLISPVLFPLVKKTFRKIKSGKGGTDNA